MRINFYNIPTSGHVNPTLPVAAELVQRGHKVVYYLTPGYRDRVEATGATFRAYDGIADDYFDAVSRRFNPARLAMQLVETAHHLLQPLVRKAEHERPDVVVYDSMCPWGRLVATKAGVPSVASMSLLELPPVYLWKSGQLPTAVRLLMSTFPWLLRYRRVARHLAHTHNVSPPAFPTILNWFGDYQVCYTSPQMLPNADRYGNEATFVGPPIGPRPDAPPFPFDRLDLHRRLIYISLGTVFNDNADFFQLCLRVFGGGEHQVVMSTGQHRSPAVLDSLPPNVIARPYVPQLEILQRASLFITHAGANSVHEGLYYGVPLLLAPQQLEQAMVAARVAELGAGLVLPRSVTAGRLQGLTKRVLDDPSFRKRADTLGATLRDAGGVNGAADAILAAASLASGDGLPERRGML